MAKPKEKAAADNAIKITVRPCPVSNVNITPEKHGHELVERFNVTLSFLLKETELGQIIRCGEKAHVRDVLWNSKGEPHLKDLVEALPLAIEFEGIAKIGYAKGETSEFDTAKLYKISVEPMLEGQATVFCQVRVDPLDRASMLARLKVDQTCKFGFTGAIAVKKAKTSGGDDDGNDDQGELPV